MFQVLKDNKQDMTKELTSLLGRLGASSSNQFETKCEIAEKICSGFNKSSFSEKENQIAVDILEILAGDIEKRIRKIIAVELAGNQSLPKSIAIQLANDIVEISQSIIEFSPVLDENDLLEIIKSTKELEKLKVMSRRKNISYKVTDELIMLNQKEVAQALIENREAYISVRGIESIIANNQNDENLLEKLINRGGLSITFVEKLITNVSVKLREKLITKYSISPAILQTIAESAREEFTLDIINYEEGRKQTDKLIDHMSENKKLNYTIILRSLCRGEMEFFEYGMAKLANIPKSNCHKLIYDPSMFGFHALYKASGMPENLFNAVKEVLKLAIDAKKDRLDDADISAKIYEKIYTSESYKVDSNVKFLMALVKSSLNSSEDNFDTNN